MQQFNFFNFSAILPMLFLCGALCAENDIAAQAAEFYANQNWSEAINAYQAITAEQSENESAWYRLAQAHIQLKQGELALNANAQLAKAKQIPKTFVLYQKAQALGLLGQTESMWKNLETASSQGYGNLKNFKTDAIFAKFQDSEQYLAINQAIDKNARPCMYDEKYREFDFWLGEWEVYGTLDKSGAKAGHNSITRAEQGCLILESWQGAGGSTGMSMNYYDGIKGQWVQRWVSGGGAVIDYAGGLIEQDGKNVMRLVGKIYYASKLQQPQVRDFRGTWTPLDHGVVQQFFEESIDGGETWKVWFNGYYFPSSEVLENAN